MPFINTDNRAVAYRDIGPRTAPAIVLGHPLGMSQAMWDEVVAALCSRFRLLTWDLPGHGASAPANGAVTAQQLAADVVALLDARRVERAHFVGTSIGGSVGQALLQAAPQRLARVALTNTGAVIGNATAWRDRAARVRDEGLAAMAPELVDGWFAAPFKTSQPAAVSGWQQQLARCDDESYALLCELLAQTDFRGRLGDVEQTVGLLAGAADTATPPGVLAALATELPVTELTTLDDVGHVPAVEAPRQFTDWLASWCGAASGTPASHEQGLNVRRSVLGGAHVERARRNARSLDAPFQDFITRMAWGELWGNADLTHRQRSMVTLAILAALGRDGELELHLDTAKTIGLSEAELRQVFMHVAIYAGVPAANHAFKLAKEHGWGEQQDSDQTIDNGGHNGQ